MDTGLDSLKTVSKKVVHKPGEFIGKKTADAVSQHYKQMEHYKISKLLYNSTVSTFVRKNGSK